jgi:hypothetical protein
MGDRRRRYRWRMAGVVIYENLGLVGYKTCADRSQARQGSGSGESFRCTSYEPKRPVLAYFCFPVKHFERPRRLLKVRAGDQELQIRRSEILAHFLRLEHPLPYDTPGLVRVRVVTDGLRRNHEGCDLMTLARSGNEPLDAGEG